MNHLPPLQIGKHLAAIPIIQGGMGVGVSMANLAAAVALEGGIGVISAAMPGIGEDATYAMVNERAPFVSFAISRGHAMLILGEHDGVPVAFDQNGYSYTDDEDVIWQIKRCSIITPAIVSYFLKFPVTFLEIK